MRLNITIPTFNRASQISTAVKAALRQDCPCSVTVVDDGSTDETFAVLQKYLTEPRFSLIRLANNVGTAVAKNVSLLLSEFDAITFHDSDDLPEDHKLAQQFRALTSFSHTASEMMNWPHGIRPGDPLRIDVVLHAYELFKSNGERHFIDNRISLVDDFFPTLQIPNKTLGDWTLINSGLFRREVFERIGGYLDIIEEDRELRNRLLTTNQVFYFIGNSLLRKFESSDSLTMTPQTGFVTDRRAKDRQIVWDRRDDPTPVEIDISAAVIESVYGWRNLRVNSTIPATEESIRLARRALDAAYDH